MSRMFPRWPDGLRWSQLAQRAVGRQLPMVGYPGHRWAATELYDELIKPFGPVSVQPTAEVWMGAWGLAEDAPIEEVTARMAVDGISGITFDGFHCQSERVHDGVAYKFKDPLALADRLARAGLVSSQHLALGRRDMAGRGPLAKSTVDAQRAFEKSDSAAGKTLEGEILMVIARAWKDISADAERQADMPAEKGSSAVWSSQDESRTVFLEEVPHVGIRNSKRRHKATLQHAKMLIAAA